MKIAVFGLGYVGFTAMCCMAKEGHYVAGVDPNEAKVRDINENRAPIIEPGVDELLQQGLEAELISAHMSPELALDGADMAIVCVGTPSAPDGSHDMRYIADVSRQIASVLTKDREQSLTVVYRSTIRPGTLEELVEPIFRSHLGNACDQLVELVYNPEFLRESSAVFDYFNPPKIVVGTKDGAPSPRMNALYANLAAPMFCTGFREAEITKFVDNSWHALKVAYANEIGRVCLKLGIRATKVHEIFVSDTKLNISPYYTRPGGAFGGSCLPKDVRALQYIASDCGAHTHIIDSLLRSNEAHKHQLFEHAIDGTPAGAKVLMVGVAFKAHTDDLRESPNVDLARKLLQVGYRVSIYDPAVNPAKLVGANFGYAYSQLPQLEKLLVSRDEAEEGQFDLVIANNATIKQLSLKSNAQVVDLSTLA